MEHPVSKIFAKKQGTDKLTDLENLGQVVTRSYKISRTVQSFQLND